MSINIESAFSFKGSLIKEKSLKGISKLGYDALGIVDDNTAFFLPFYLEMKKEDIKPILGLRVKGEYFDYILYPTNFKGYKEILYFASSRNKNDVIDFSELPISSNILYVFDIARVEKENFSYIKEEYSILKARCDTYLGLDFSYYPCESSLYPEFKDYPCIILDKVKYIKSSDKHASDILNSLLFKKPLEEENIFDIDSSINYHLMSKKEFLEAYKKYPKLIKNTELFISKIDIEIEFTKPLPKYPVKSGMTSETYLRYLSEKGLSRRLRNTTKNLYDYKKRLDYELSIIHSMGFDDYFLVVYDFILYAKKDGILIGPGRGSAAGSLVSYCLGIVDIDPLEYGLLFERFLNPARKTMPDIDTDFESKRREDVIKYVSSKYGKTHVSLISTFVTYQARSAVDDVSKLLGIREEKVNVIKKAIPDDNNNITYLASIPNIKTMIEQDPEIKDLLSICYKIEGLPITTSIHAAGVIIADNDLREYSEIHMDKSGIITTTYDQDSLKALGLLKMDFLSLKNLDQLHKMIDDIKEFEGKEISLSKIPLNNKKAFDVLTKVSTLGVFQLESKGMEETVRGINVSSFEDLMLCLAIYRPSSKEYINLYLQRKNGKAKIDYYDDSIKDILKETLGIIVYQEQTMQICSKYAGLSLSDADMVRRAISSKDPALINEIKPKFIKGALNLGRNIDVTNRLFDDITKFADYGFNKSHAVSYAHIAYWDAYIKANYPSIFMMNVLEENRTIKAIKECNKLGVKVTPPDMRSSSYRYISKGNYIILPFTVISGIGLSIAKDIVSVRDKSDGTFESFVKNSKDILNKQVIESLIMAGAFDYTNYNKRTMVESLDGLYEFSELEVEGISEYKVKVKDEYPFDYLQKAEFDLLKYNPKNHPIKSYKGELKSLSDVNTNTIKPVKFVAYVQDLKEIRTKKGDIMASLVIEDEYMSMNAIVFPMTYLSCAHYLKKNKLYEFSGTFENDNRGKKQFTVRTVIEV